ncbi:MAG: GAP family protein [Actinomycetota bacterium]|nr:GAP family protein [Actinomycetota bacterium]
MIAGPQIITATMLATSEKALRNSYAYVGGAILASTAATAAFYYTADALGLEGSDRESGSVVLDWVLVVLLLVAAGRVFLKRHDAEPPQYMQKLQTASPGASFRLGFLLFLFMPTDLIVTFTVGTFLASHGEPLWRSVGFLLVTGLLIGAPLLVLLVMGRRAETVLPALRSWMNANAWVVSEVVIALFLVLQIQSIVSA